MAVSMKQQATLVKMTIVGLTILLLWGELQQVEGGCSRFGHSCFGAHGKRTDPSVGLSNNFDMMMPSGEVPVSASYGGGFGQPLRSDFYPNYIASNNPNANRISPYLIDWIMSAHRGELRQPQPLSKEEMGVAERRK